MIHHVGGKPNVLVILTDQQRFDAIGYANPAVSTPNLDALAKISTVCNTAVVQSPQCQPSRASIFTGRYPTAHRVWWNETDMPWHEPTLGNYLRRAGYRTGYFGKLHFDGSEPYTQVAQHFGFDSSYLFEDWLREDSVARTDFHMAMGHKGWTGAVTDRGHHHEEMITDKALEFITTGKQPYFCVVSYHGPHPPYAAPPEFSDLYRDLVAPVADKERGLTAEEWVALKREYYGAVSWIDACVGRLLAGVALPNTVVVFTSDHGDILGDHGLFSKGVYAYEGNVRVPLIVHRPGREAATEDGVVESIAILPTILRACDIAIPMGVQGSPIDSPKGYALSMIGHPTRLRMIRTDSLKYWVLGEREFLFDMSDPAEIVNLAGRDAWRDDLLEMRWRLLQGLIAAEDPLPLPRPR